MNDDKKRKYADALQELLKTNSYNKISVNDICLMCGTYRPNFYYHFQNKDDLLNWIFVQDYETSEYSKKGEVYRHTVFLKRLKKHTSFYLKTLGGDTNSDFYLFIKSMFKQYVFELYSLNNKIMDERSCFRLEYLASSYVMTVYEWLCGNIELSEEKLAVYLCDNIRRICHRAM